MTTTLDDLVLERRIVRLADGEIGLLRDGYDSVLDEAILWMWTPSKGWRNITDAWGVSWEEITDVAEVPADLGAEMVALYAVPTEYGDDEPAPRESLRGPRDARVWVGLPPGPWNIDAAARIVCSHSGPAYVHVETSPRGALECTGVAVTVFRAREGLRAWLQYGVQDFGVGVAS